MYPLLSIDEMLAAVKNSKYSCVKHITKEYNKAKTPFSFFGGHYEYDLMPFELCNSASTFQILMDSVLLG